MIWLFAALLSQAEVDDSIKTFGPSCQVAASCVVIWTPKTAKTIFDTVCVRIDRDSQKIMKQWLAIETPDVQEDGQTLYRPSCPSEPWSFPWPF